MAKISEPIQCTTRKTSIRLGEMAHRSRQGDSVHKWVNEKTPGATAVVLTDAALVYNIPEGKAVFIRKAWMIMLTLSDSCTCNLVSCTAVDGGGVATDIDGHLRVASSLSLYGAEHYERDYRVPICVKYSDCARSVSIKVDANDASAKIGCGWQGWAEPE